MPLEDVKLFLVENENFSPFLFAGDAKVIDGDLLLMLLVLQHF